MLEFWLNTMVYKWIWIQDTQFTFIGRKILSFEKLFRNIKWYDYFSVYNNKKPIGAWIKNRGRNSDKEKHIIRQLGQLFN